MEAQGTETLQESLDRLRVEVTELRASRERLVLAADAERRTIERDLHDGPQQHLVALAANIQLASGLMETDPGSAKALLDEMGRDVRRALDEAAKLAHRIYPPLLEAGGLAAALRAAANSLGVPTRVQVARGAGYPQEVAGTVYFCCLDVLEHAGEGAHATIEVRDEDAVLVFEAAVDEGSGGGEARQHLRDRVEALGGRLTVSSTAGGGTRVSGSLPL